MKIERMIWLTFLTLLSTSAMTIAQNTNDEPEMQTLFGNSKFTLGVMGGPQIGLSKFNGKDVILAGGRGGIIINHCIVIGGGGWGIVNMPKFSNNDGTINGYLEGGYGGILIEPIFMSKKLVHLSIPILIGGGELVYSNEMSHNNMHDSFNEIDSDQFFVLESGIEIELNLVRFLRIAAGCTYRWAPNLVLLDTPSDPFNGITSSITFKFGSY